MDGLVDKRISISEKRDLIFRKSSKGSALDKCLEYGSVIDLYLLDSLSSILPVTASLCAWGSYSRRELSPFSDINLLLLLNNPLAGEEILDELKKATSSAGLKISFITVQFDALEKIFSEDSHLFTGFFDTRFLTGNLNLYTEFRCRILEYLSDEKQILLYNTLKLEAVERYNKFGDSPKFIEPNIKMTSGGLRDLSFANRLYAITNKTFIDAPINKCQSIYFIEVLENDNYIGHKEAKRLFKSVTLLLAIRNALHLVHRHRNDRFEFTDQIKVATMLGYQQVGYVNLMKDYFNATTIISRLNTSYVKNRRRFLAIDENVQLPIILDDNFILKGRLIFCIKEGNLSLPEILQGFYFRGHNNAIFDDLLRLQIVNSLDFDENQHSIESGIYFKMILQLHSNVGKTLGMMNELGVLGKLIPQFDELNGFIEHGIYHCYTADEHTIKAISNLEKLDKDDSITGVLYRASRNKPILFLALLFHDIAKPILLEGHEILGADIAEAIMTRFHYDDNDIELVKFLIRFHKLMPNTAFRRDLNNPSTLNSFIQLIPSTDHLSLLYLLTFADLSAVNSALWTNWKSDLLNELYRKSFSMLDDELTGEELLYPASFLDPQEIAKHSESVSIESIQDHLDHIEGYDYISQFSEEEIARHIEEINSGDSVSTIFSDSTEHTVITVISHDSPSLLAKLCGVMLLNDVNILDAKIFTRKDGIVIDIFTVTDARNGLKLSPTRFRRIEDGFKLTLIGHLPIAENIKDLRNMRWRFENRLFYRSKKKLIIKFEETAQFTIIDIFSSDRIGLLYQITHKLSELGLSTYFARISTLENEVTDSFYVLDQEKMKIPPSQYYFIRNELLSAIKLLL